MGHSKTEYAHIESRIWDILLNMPILNQEYGTFLVEYGYHKIGYGHILLNMGHSVKRRIWAHSIRIWDILRTEYGTFCNPVW